MRFYLRWPTTAADCDYWSRQPDTDGPDGNAGAVDEYAISVAAVAGEVPHARYRRVAERLWRYDIFPPDLMHPTVCSEDSRVGEGVVIVQRVRVGLVVSEAAVRIVRVWRAESVDAEESGFTYATLAGHPEKGVSSFSVVRRADKVEFVIKARSRPGTLVTQIGRPLSRAFQRTATRAALRHVASPV